MYGYTYGYPSGGGAGAVNGFESAVLSDGGTVVAIGNTTDLYSRLLGLGLINSASLVNSCNGGKADALYNFVPSPVQALDRFTVTRASTKLRIGSNGLYGSVANNVPAFEFNTDGTYRGLLVEPGATNLALNSRNLTAVSWVSTNMTAALTATGADGAVNSATTLTATAGNATELQAITSASASRVFSAVVRRRTGTGVVEITQDNGSTWTAITLTTSFQRFTTPNQTLTNPTVGFRIVTSGDAIDVDFCQAETGSVATSPIVTTAGTASRVADSNLLASASSLIGQTEGTLYAEVNLRAYAGTANRRIFDIYTDGSNRITLGAETGITISATVVNGGGVQAQIVTGVFSAGIKKIAFAYKANDFALYIDGVQIGTDVSGTVPTVSNVSIGTNASGGANLGDHIRSCALFPTRLANATLISLTTP
jgi:hypothetical protein